MSQTLLRRGALLVLRFVAYGLVIFATQGIWDGTGSTALVIVAVAGPILVLEATILRWLGDRLWPRT